jgi:D-glycero-D-manno-heptose 1,7-bisphosphate phosphatase
MSLHKRALFLDRDGTINEEVSFLSDPELLRLIPGADEAIREANDLGFMVFVISNQSGVARGFLSEADLLKIHDTLVEMLNKRGAHVDAIYYCPHHPEIGEGSYRALCDCRKPGTGMLERAAREYGVDLSESFVIGDRMVDVQTGTAAGTKTILVLSGYGVEEQKLCQVNGVRTDFVARDLKEALEFVKRTVTQTRMGDSSAA